MQQHRSSATLLALIFALLIIHPFSFLNAPWPRYWSRFDVIANFVGYAPLGFLVTLSLLRTRLLPQPALLATSVCSLLSLLLEALQSYLPLRVPQLSDWLLNSGGAFLGAVLAIALERIGAIDHWSRFRERWFVRDARVALVLLALWPAALLFPPAHDFVDDLLEGTPLSALMDDPVGYVLPLSNLSELICVALGVVIPCLLAYGVTLGWHRRALLWVGGALTALAGSSLSAALSYSPEHAWGWLSLPAQVGLGMGIVIALMCVWLPRKLCLGLLVVALVWQMSLINAAPETPYYAQALQSWEQGRFIRFHGIAQWLGWIWPYAALTAAMMALTKRDKASR
jgi:VanZ family protein